jgi:hypothetical protein
MYRIFLKHSAHPPLILSSKCRLFHNATFFGFYIICILHTECAKISMPNFGTKRLTSSVPQIVPSYQFHMRNKEYRTTWGRKCVEEVWCGTVYMCPEDNHTTPKLQCGNKASFHQNTHHQTGMKQKGLICYMSCSTLLYVLQYIAIRPAVHCFMSCSTLLYVLQYTAICPAVHCSVHMNTSIRVGGGWQLH